VSARTVFVSFTGMLKYRLVISRDANVNCGHMEVSCKFRSRSVVFFILNVFGSGAILFTFCVNSFDSL
jgi:hypothetical protein